MAEMRENTMMMKIKSQEWEEKANKGRVERSLLINISLILFFLPLPLTLCLKYMTGGAHQLLTPPFRINTSSPSTSWRNRRTKKTGRDGV